MKADATRAVRGSLTLAYQSAYRIGRKGLPLPENTNAENAQIAWLTRNGWADGITDLTVTQ